MSRATTFDGVVTRGDRCRGRFETITSTCAHSPFVLSLSTGPSSRSGSSFPSDHASSSCASPMTCNTSLTPGMRIASSVTGEQPIGRHSFGHPTASTSLGRGSHAHRGTYVVERTSFSIIIVEGAEGAEGAVEARGVVDDDGEDAEAEAAAARDSSGPPFGGTLDAANLDGTRDDELGPGCIAMDEHHDEDDDEDDDRAMPSSDAEVAARSFPSPEGVTASHLRDTSDGDTGFNYTNAVVVGM